MQRKILGSSHLNFVKIFSILSRKHRLRENIFISRAKPRHAYAIEKRQTFRFATSLLGLSKVHFVSPAGNVELTVLKKD